MQDKLAYKFKGAGHEEPEKKREYKKPDKRLQEAFEKWLNEGHHFVVYEKWYRYAEQLLKNISANIDETHSLLLTAPDDLIRYAGFFVSAVYNKSPENHIIFDVSIPAAHIGHRLAKGKTLVVLSATGHDLGKSAKGTVLNYGNSDYEEGYKCEGLHINYGSSKGEFGRHAFGTVINMGKQYDLHMIPGTPGYLIDFAKTENDTDWGKLAEDALGYSDPQSPYQDMKPFEIRNYTIEHMLTHEEKKIPELWDYLMQLKQILEQGRDYKKAFEIVDSFGPEPAKTIKTTIDDIFKRNGYEI